MGKGWFEGDVSVPSPLGIIVAEEDAGAADHHVLTPLSEVLGDEVE